MADVFLSYKRSRREIVQRLAAALQAHGWDVWFDARLTEGEQFRKEIENELAASRCAVVLWCNESVQSDFVLDEAGWAKTQGALVQARWMSLQPPLGFGQQQLVDIIGWQKGIPQLSRLVETIERMIGPPGEPTKGPMGRPDNAKIISAIGRAQTEEMETRLRSLEQRLASEQTARQEAEREAERLRAAIEKQNSANQAKESNPAIPKPTLVFPKNFFLDVAEELVRNKRGRVAAFAPWDQTPQGIKFWGAEDRRLSSGGELSPEAIAGLEEMIAIAKATGKYRQLS